MLILSKNDSIQFLLYYFKTMLLSFHFFFLNFKTSKQDYLILFNPS